MRYEPIDPVLFTANRERLKRLLLPNSLVVVNANDVLPTNSDGTLAMCPNSDLFYLTGVEQEQSILLLYPDADDEKHREILFLREPTPQLETWEGHKLTRDEARKLTGIHRVEWLAEFPHLLHRLMPRQLFAEALPGGDVLAAKRQGAIGKSQPAHAVGQPRGHQPSLGQ